MIQGWGLGMDGNTPTLDTSGPFATFTITPQGTLSADRALTVPFILNYRFLAFDGDTPTLRDPVENGYTVHIDGDTPYADSGDTMPWPRSIGPDIGDPLYDNLG